MRLPPPLTFAEGQRYVYGLLAAAAGVFCGLATVAMIVGLLAGGPVGRFKLSANSDGASLEADCGPGTQPVEQAR